GTNGYANDLGLNARFNNPLEIAIGTGGILYVSDFANRIIRAITPGGDVSLFAGTPNVAGSGNGPVLTATFVDPIGIAADQSGNVYVSALDIHMIRKFSRR